jgi:hypothetical protein
VDAREEWDAFERRQWRREGDTVQREAELAAKTHIRERDGWEGSSNDKIV